MAIKTLKMASQYHVSYVPNEILCFPGIQFSIKRKTLLLKYKYSSDFFPLFRQKLGGFFLSKFFSKKLEMPFAAYLHVSLRAHLLLGGLVHYLLITSRASFAFSLINDLIK
jgi:hypothetical protein